MKILLVDDYDSNLKFLQFLLESQHHVPICARNGAEALLKACEDPPDLIISDILMPVMDGYALCRAWMEDPRLCGIPFIFYTATYQSEEDETFGLSLGAAAFLRKPLAPKAFLAQIQGVIDQRQAGALPLAEPAPLDGGSFLKRHNERLAQKLDERTQKLAHRVDDLQKAESSLRLKSAALEAAANGILITDRHGTIEWVNPAFLAITGFDRADVIGNNPRVLNSGLHGAEFYEHLWKTILTEHIWRGEMVNRHKDGTLRTFNAAITPVLDEDGAITHFIDIVQDITDMKRVEAELRQSQKMEAVGRLAGGVAHDFNNMLNVILLNADLALMAGNLSEAQKKRMQEIQHAGERSADLTRQLLAFSRKQPAQPVRINLNKVVEENQKMLHRMIEGDIELVFHPAPDLQPVSIDPSQVTQILANLVINARDALSGPGTISIETANVEVDVVAGLIHGGLPPGGYVKLTVSDTGSGMDPATLEHIFEPFFTTKAEGQGTGLGLATVYGIVKQNRGTISACSHLGLGTSMKIYLPHCLEADAAGAQKVQEAPRGGNETILVAEDEASMLKVIKIALEGKGYTVLASPNPLDACLLAEHYQGPIQLLVTDVVMPGMNGMELQDRIALARPGLKVLFTSGYTDDILAKRGLMRENIHFLQKPFRIPDLARKVRELLDGV